MPSTVEHNGKTIPYTPLDAWTEGMGLERFRDKELETHLRVYGIKDRAERETLSRLILISLRQALTDESA